MEPASESSPHAPMWRAAREDEEEYQDLPLDFLLSFYGTIRELNQHIDNFNARKRSMYDGVRVKFGRHQAEALKIAMRDLFTDPRKREEKATFNKIARHYVDRLETEIDARQYDV